MKARPRRTACNLNETTFLRKCHMAEGRQGEKEISIQVYPGNKQEASDKSIPKDSPLRRKHRIALIGP